MKGQSRKRGSGQLGGAEFGCGKRSLRVTREREARASRQTERDAAIVRFRKSHRLLAAGQVANAQCRIFVRGSKHWNGVHFSSLP